MSWWMCDTMPAVVLWMRDTMPAVVLWMQSRFAERELQVEQKKVTSQSDRRDLRRQVT